MKWATVILILIILIVSCTGEEKASGDCGPDNCEACDENGCMLNNESCVLVTWGHPGPYLIEEYPCFTRKACESHLDCNPKGGISNYLIGSSYCRDGKCREPLNKEEEFIVCDAVYEDADEIEECKMDACVDAYYKNKDISAEEEECIQAVRTSTCDDGRYNGRESDVDCGGVDCEPCDNEKECESDSDCKSGICNTKGYYYGYCVGMCPDGRVKDNAPCACFVPNYPEDPTAYTVESVEGWEEEYGRGKTIFCCGGSTRQMDASKEGCSDGVTYKLRASYTENTLVTNWKYGDIVPLDNVDIIREKGIGNDAPPQQLIDQLETESSGAIFYISKFATLAYRYNGDLYEIYFSDVNYWGDAIGSYSSECNGAREKPTWSCFGARKINYRVWPEELGINLYDVTEYYLGIKITEEQFSKLSKQDFYTELGEYNDIIFLDGDYLYRGVHVRFE